MADIKRILNKKGWTGRELGILELTNMATIFQQRYSGEEVKPIVPAEQFKRMVSDLTDRSQIMTYNGYIAIHEWLAVKAQVAQAQLQQAQLQFRTLESYTAQALFAEDVFRYVEQLPAIMTQKQYDKTRAARIEAYFKDKDGEELYSDVFNLVERFIAYYLHLLQREPKKPNPLKSIREKYIAEPVKSKLILSRYCSVMGEGYYTLEDGRRSDQMTAEEWQEAITTPAMREALTAMRTGDEAGKEYTVEEALARLLAKNKLIFEGKTEEEADKAQRKADYEKGLAVPAQWHTYEAPQKPVKKWDIIEQETLLEFYPADIDGSGDAYSKSNFTASMEDFVGEFGELVAVALADIGSLGLGGEKLSELPISEWGTIFYSWRELYEKNIYGEREEAEADTNIFNGNFRALFNGIAIVRPSDILNKSRRINEQGYYVEPSIAPAIANFSLEAFFQEAKDYADNVEIVENARKTLLDSYYFLIGYNYSLDIVMSYYDVPALAIFKIDIADLADKIDALNKLTFTLYRQIKDTQYGDTELKAKKLQVLKDFFQPLEYKNMDIPAENKAEAEELLKDFKAFKPEFTDRFYSLLHERPSEDTEGGLE